MPNITMGEYNRLKRDSDRLKSKIEEELLVPFVRKFTGYLGTLAAHTPRSEWPHEFNVAFNHAKAEMPELAAIYLERMEKE